AGSNMNVMINDISKDLDTTVQGVQTAITLFLLVMAALMIPGSKWSDRVGRKRCFTVGLAVYGVGALLSAISPGLGVLILGNSLLEGFGSALLIPPVYILTTLIFTDLTSRARAFGRISGRGGLGAAAGRACRTVHGGVGLPCRARPVERGAHHPGHQLASRVPVPDGGDRHDRAA